ncbi:hypothetical protein LTR04_005028, partial [Oleoguttula sp. CCFEE 6159]
MSSRSTTPSAALPSYDEFVESGLTPVSIAALPASADTSCAICRTEYTAADGVCVPTRLACGHIMGEECLFKWWEQGDSNTCPLCRRELFRREPSAQEGEEEEGESWEPMVDADGSGFPGFAALLPHVRAAMSRRAAAEEALPAEVLARFEARERDEQRDLGPLSEAELAAADEEEAREAEAEAEAHARTEEEKAREEALYQ